MSQNKHLFECSRNEAPRSRNDALPWICMVLLTLTLAACGGGGGSDDSASFTQQNVSNEVDPLPNNVPGGGGNGDPIPDPVDPNNPNAPPQQNNDEAIFAATLHLEIRKPANFCIACHDNPAFTPAIDFAVADVASSYAIITGQALVNLAVPNQSSLYQRPLGNHNCGAECNRIATEYLAAITDWASQVNAGGNQPPAGNVVASAAINFSQVVEGSVSRADTNVITTFNFAEGAGTTTAGISNIGAGVILNLEGTEWVAEGGLRNVTGKAQASLADSQKLFNLLSGGNQFSVEAWVIPENTAQAGPARVVSFSIGTGRRNFTLGQTNTQYISRVQTLETGPNGSNPELKTDNDVLNTELTHVVMTYDNMAGGRKIYVNGQLATEETIQGDMLNWQDDNLFVLGNEVTNNRLWKGVFKMVAIHNKALNGAEVAQNFEAGEGAITALRFDVASILGAPGYIEMQAYEIDPFAYVFAKPKLVSAVTGVAVKNIRIAVNNNVPVAMQAFRRVDMTVLQSGQEISPLGALIPSDLGMALDQFHLEFEVLAGQTGTTELIGLPVPPADPVDVDEPDAGVRTFSQVHDTMAALTGISKGDSDVRNRYDALRDQLPPNANLLGFGAAQQIAVQRLATTYCGEITKSNSRCRNFFSIGACQIGANEKDAIAGSVYDKIIGNNLVNQPAKVATTVEFVQIMNDLNCTNGCNDAIGRLVLQAVCAAALASSAVTIN